MCLRGQGQELQLRRGSALFLLAAPFDRVLAATMQGPLQGVLTLAQNPAVVTALGAAGPNLATAVTNITVAIPNMTTTRERTALQRRAARSYYYF